MKSKLIIFFSIGFPYSLNAGDNDNISQLKKIVAIQQAEIKKLNDQVNGQTGVWDPAPQAGSSLSGNGVAKDAKFNRIGNLIMYSFSVEGFKRRPSEAPPETAYLNEHFSFTLPVIPKNLNEPVYGSGYFTLAPTVPISIMGQVSVIAHKSDKTKGIIIFSPRNVHRETADIRFVVHGQYSIK